MAGDGGAWFRRRDRQTRPEREAQHCVLCPKRDHGLSLSEDQTRDGMKTRRVIREEQGEIERHIGKRVGSRNYHADDGMPESNGLLPDAPVFTCRHPLSPTLPPTMMPSNKMLSMDKKRILVSMSYLEQTQPPLPYRARDALPKTCKQKCI